MPSLWKRLWPLFTRGGGWLDALRSYLYGNKQRAAEFIHEELPSIHLVPSQATYLLWLDCGRLGMSGEEIAETIRRETGLYLSEGSQYGSTGENFLRLNIACPRTVLEDGLRRLKAGIAAVSG